VLTETFVTNNYFIYFTEFTILSNELASADSFPTSMKLGEWGMVQVLTAVFMKVPSSLLGYDKDMMWCRLVHRHQRFAYIFR
jgi:hypothetical protein